MIRLILGLFASIDLYWSLILASSALTSVNLWLPRLERANLVSGHFTFTRPPLQAGERSAAKGGQFLVKKSTSFVSV